MARRVMVREFRRRDGTVVRFHVRSSSRRANRALGDLSPGPTKTLYRALKDAGLHVESHESDLYVPVSETSTRILRQYAGRVSYSRFQSEGKAWYDVAFAYDPFWEKNRRK